MYRKSSRWARSSASRGGFRRRVSPMRTSDRKANRPRWNVGNFNLNSEVPVNYSVSQPYTNTMIALAQSASRVGDDSGGGSQGRSITRAVRFLDIGGIVITAGWNRVAQLVTADLADDSDALDQMCQQLIVVDRLDGTGAPLSIAYDWGLNTVPTGSTTSSSSANEPQDAPTRILKRWGGHQSFAFDPASITSSTSFARTQEVRNSRWSYNLRLRLRLDPEHGLWLVNHARRIFSADAELNIDRANRFWAFGTIYYRWSF